MKVIEIINAREQVLSEINEITKAENDRKVTELEHLLLKLRQASIRAVELIVLWRDQFRYFALMTSKQRLARKKKAQKAIQTPYLCDPKDMFDCYCENYLLKMRHDTKHLGDIQMIKANFNVMTPGQADPFLAQLSIAGRAAGSDIRSLKKA